MFSLQLEGVPFLSSWLLPGPSACSSWEHRSPRAGDVAEPQSLCRRVLAPHPLRHASILRHVPVKCHASLDDDRRTHPARTSPAHSDGSWSSHSSSPSTPSSISPVPLFLSQGHRRRPDSSLSRPSPSSARVALPLPFSGDQIQRTVTFTSRHGGAVSLSEWARLAEKKKTHLALASPHEPLDEPLADDTRALFQFCWPGYAPKTHFIDLPYHDEGAGVTQVDLLDIVCKHLLDWIVKLTNDRHIACQEPQWTVGLDRITFRHIFVAGVVQTHGYIAKWVPVLEIDFPDA